MDEGNPKVTPGPPKKQAEATADSATMLEYSAIKNNEK